MRALLSRVWLLIVTAVIVVGGGVGLTLQTGNPLCVAVAGSMVTCLGAVAACRKFIRLGFREALVSNFPVSGGAILPTQDDLDHARQEDLDDRASLLALTLILVGTPLQVFGYLLAG